MVLNKNGVLLLKLNFELTYQFFNGPINCDLEGRNVAIWISIRLT